jgi:hypothetical protein
MVALAGVVEHLEVLDKGVILVKAEQVLFPVVAVVEPVLTLWASRLLHIQQQVLGKALHLN